MRKIIIAIIALLLLVLAGCAAPTCYPPNKILGNKCCLDSNNNEKCDFEEGAAQTAEETEPVVKETVTEIPQETTEETTEPVLPTQTERQQAVAPAPKPATDEIQLGKQKMNSLDPHQYLQINKLEAYRTSTDKGMMDYMVYTVRNIGPSDLDAMVELYFEGARLEEHQIRILKEYRIPVLKAGEKIVIQQSLGIYFADINATKKITMSIYKRLEGPRKDLEVLKKEFVPKTLFPTMEIFTYGKPELD
jgi:hypothetical protein